MEGSLGGLLGVLGGLAGGGGLGLLVGEPELLALVHGGQALAEAVHGGGHGVEGADALLGQLVGVEVRVVQLVAHGTAGASAAGAGWGAAVPPGGSQPSNALRSLSRSTRCKRALTTLA